MFQNVHISTLSYQNIFVLMRRNAPHVFVLKVFVKPTRSVCRENESVSEKTLDNIPSHVLFAFRSLSKHFII